MSVIEEVRREREDLARVLKKHSGIRKIVEDLYPDSAHFIYELLQNAEDTGATEASFALSEKSLVFEHNGRAFESRDIYAITDIGEGTKQDDNDKIGRFGVGFKAVFAYSETPHIWSPTYSFKITDLVLPWDLTPQTSIGKVTRFEFPFNNPKKTPQDAFAEIKRGFEELAETTLLFLSHIDSLSWSVGNTAYGAVLRIQHPRNHVEVLKQFVGQAATSAHFLKFDRLVEGLEAQKVAVAFPLGFLPGLTKFDAEQSLDAQFNIIPAQPGQVAVFFPAEKEVSGLRFHLHAPFIPELSRASIKETPANDPLFQQLAALVTSSLHQIRDLRLLSVDFLAVLPNPQDQIPPRYRGIRAAIVKAMNHEPLTPTNAKHHAPAKYLLQAKAALKELLAEDDLEILIDYEEEAPKWAAAAAQRNSNADRFLAGLKITEWEVNELIEIVFYEQARFTEWLSNKSLAWHQRFYSLLYTEASQDWRLRRSKLIRLTNSAYSIGEECFFSSDDVGSDEFFPRVDATVYTSGKSKLQHENARKFLEAVGVREVGEADQVEVILQQRYTDETTFPDDETHQADVKRFIALLEKVPGEAGLFADYWIFRCSDNLWAQPSQVFLDHPFMATGLSAYYDAFGKGPRRVGLSENYLSWNVAVEKLAEFAKVVGVQAHLEISQTHCYGNPEYDKLVYSSPGGWSDLYGINRDYRIVELGSIIHNNSLELSRLVWKTACERKDFDWLYAQFRNNSKYATNKAPSQIVCLLRDSKWIPQTDGRFVRPSQATRDLLPKGFPFDPGWRWLEAIHFGKEAAKRSEEQRRKHAFAKESGFPDHESFERAKRFAALPPDEQERFLVEQEYREGVELPEHEPSNPERRAERVGAQADDAPERHTEKRTRSVSVGRELVKEEAAQYLLQQYTNSNDEMICQVCKKQLPFKLDDGTSYFEKVEFLPDLQKRHYQNYLALCPNHAAMFQYANGSNDLLQEMFVEMQSSELEVVLAQKDETIYFTKTHIADIRAVIEAEEAISNSATKSTYQQE